jgi:hypothetical protein
VDAANLSAGQPLDMYDTDAVERVAVNLFYGWGYNFYRVENQLRADDLLARHHVAGIVAEARKTVDRAEAAFRAEKLPPPTREKPTHDPQAMRDVATLEALARRIAALADRIRAQPAPENDRITQRHRREAETLARLLAADTALTGRAEALRLGLAAHAPGWMLEHAEALGQYIDLIETALRDRAAILAVSGP